MAAHRSDETDENTRNDDPEFRLIVKWLKGLVIPRLSLTGEMSFTKVCVTAPYELFIVYYHFTIQTNIYV